MKFCFGSNLKQLYICDMKLNFNASDSLEVKLLALACTECGMRNAKKIAKKKRKSITRKSCPNDRLPIHKIDNVRFDIEFRFQLFTTKPH